jgi:hypothetical protein
MLLLMVHVILGSRRLRGLDYYRYAPLVARVYGVRRLPDVAAVGFNKKKKGARSYYPLFATVAQTSQFYGMHHRPGNVHDSNGAVDFIAQTLYRQPKSFRASSSNPTSTARSTTRASSMYSTGLTANLRARCLSNDFPSARRSLRPGDGGGVSTVTCRTLKATGNLTNGTVNTVFSSSANAARNR